MPRFYLWLFLCAWPTAAATQSTTTIMTLASGNPVYGAVLGITAQVNAPAGTVTFIVDGQPQTPYVLGLTGTPIIFVSFLPGTHTVGASFSGSDGYLPSTAVPLSVVVAKASTTVNLAANLAQIEQPVIISASVGIVSPGSGTAVGTVAFLTGSISLTPISGCAAVPVQNGVATCTTSFASTGVVLLNAIYSGDANTAASQNTLPITVSKVVAGVYLADAPDPPVWGNQVTVNALVLGAQNVAAPTGTVTFASGGQTLATPALGTDGRASVATSYAVGTYAITAVYSGDANYLAAAPVVLNLAVGRAPTALVVSADPAQIGQPVTLRASVSLVSGTGSITGTVDFIVGGKPVTGCTGVAVSSGTASCQTTFPQLGTFTLGGSFSGDANTLPSTATAAGAVNKAVPSLYLASTPAAPVYGIPVTLSALVLGAQSIAAPTGTVQFTDGPTQLSPQSLGADGHALYTSPFAVGNHTIAAVYSGDSNYQASAPGAASFTLAVGKAPTVLTVSSDPAQIGQPLTLRASVSLVAGAGVITGTVDFSIGGKPVAGCTGVAISSGAASCQTTVQQLATYTLAGSFSGDANTLPSTASATGGVNKAAPSLYLTSTPAAPVYGIPVALSALVLGAQNIAAPTGTVQFTDGPTQLPPQTLGPDGHAVYTSPFTVGTHTITAVYSGDANYQAPGAASLTLAVGKAPTVVAVSSDPAQMGQPVMLHSSVSLASGSGAITGTVDFTVAGKPVAACTGISISNGSAACQTTFPKLITYTLGANFSGDANTLPGTASAPVAVNKIVAGIYLASSPATPVFGAPLTLDVLLLGATAVPAPTGTVTFFDAGKILAVEPVGADGRASFAPSLAVGGHNIAAVYNGDANYQPAVSSPATVAVGQAATATSLTAVTGGPFTAVVTVVAPGAGSPTGIVQFRGATAVAGTAPLVAQGSGFTATLANTTATGSISASYIGDANFSASTSTAVSVSPTQTLVTVTSDRNPSSLGQVVNFTVAVSLSPRAAAAPPTGTVTLSADGANSQTASLTGGQATFQATLGAGSHTVTASYSGDALYPAAIGTFTQVVGPAAASLTVTSSAPVAVYGQPVTLTAQLGPQTGSVQFSDGATVLGAANIGAGVAALPVNLAVGVHTIVASWPGDNTSGAASAQLTQTVNQAATTTRLTISGGSLLATVTANAPGAGSPTGSVRFLDAATSTVLAAIVLSGASAAAPLPSVTDAIVAVYSGDNNFLGGASSTLRLLAVTNAASYLAGDVAPDELLTLFGPNLFAGSTTVKLTDSAGTSRTASLLFVSPAQATILMPPDAAPGPATLTVTNAVRALSAPIAITAVAPGLFTADGSGQGAPAAQVITVHPDGTQDAPQPATSPIDLSDPAASVYLVLYATGIRHAAAAPVCTIGAQPATVIFAGPQGSMAGLDQVNLLLPPALQGSGTVPLILTVDGHAANSVTLIIP